VGIYVLVALHAVRLALKSEWVRLKARALLRFLQVIHVPLGWVVFAAAVLHGVGFLIYDWETDFSSWYAGPYLRPRRRGTWPRRPGGSPPAPERHHGAAANHEVGQEVIRHLGRNYHDGSVRHGDSGTGAGAGGG
jgi:hypothetical protein